jgi:hypothetical protein
LMNAVAALLSVVTRILHDNHEPQRPFSPWGEGAPKGRMRGPSVACPK